ncbi:MAG: glutamate-5-semialdehyde dehydrogenase [Methanomassiliicoccaceae archaeon]|nr:glutamate-5-semialdehyde dehydrogenase [Methanomassiliicoccaceae archaeon]
MAQLTSRIKEAREASLVLAALDTGTKNNALKAMAAALDGNRERILEANRKDVSAAEEMSRRGEMPASLVKRLKVDDEKISGMVAGIEDVTRLEDPVGETMSALKLDEGLTLYQVKCPIGMLGVIFESRPDVVPQILSLCLKSGNGVAFKGGSEASNSNRVLFDVLTEAAYSAGVPRGAFVLMETREDIGAILGMHGDIDLLIPRGSNEFVRYIQENTRIPVLGHSAGICHVYVDDEADMDIALAVTLDSKVQYPAVCNAAETLLVNSKIAGGFLPMMAKLFKESGVEMRVDARAKAFVPKDVAIVDAKDEDWDAEYNDMVISIAVVDSLDEAIGFINRHGSHHTDAIVTRDGGRQSEFVRRVDSADVFVNASTRFSDGFRYGKGAEVGISTNKVHSRGPVGMEGLMIYKYVLIGNGQVVKDYVGKDAKRFLHQRTDERYGG